MSETTVLSHPGRSHPARTSAAVSDRDGVRVEVVSTVDDPDHIWSIYEISASGLGVLAAARHVMTREEFGGFATDPHVIKILGSGADGVPMGLALLTNDLERVDWISPGFFARMYPTHAENSTLFYLAFIAVHPDRRGMGLLPQMIAKIASVVNEAGGVCCFDVCRFNDEVLPVKEMGRVDMDGNFLYSISRIDDQRWYAVHFDDEAVRS